MPRPSEKAEVGRRRVILRLNHRFNGLTDDTEKSVQSASSVAIRDSDDGRERPRVPEFDHRKIYTRAIFVTQAFVIEKILQ